MELFVANYGADANLHWLNSMQLFIDNLKNAHLQQMEREIAKYKEENQMSASRGDRFSRACSGCYLKEPRRRVVAVACGHAFCRKCADGAVDCSMCKKPTAFVRLFETEKNSRECGICLDTPFRRAFFEVCGHIACCVCVAELRKSKIDAIDVGCPFCRTESRELNVLKEEVIDNELDESDDNDDEILPKWRLKLQTERMKGKNQRQVCQNQKRTRPNKHRLNQPQKR